jgi:hypothetical protein
MLLLLLLLLLLWLLLRRLQRLLWLWRLLSLLPGALLRLLLNWCYELLGDTTDEVLNGTVLVVERRLQGPLGQRPLEAHVDELREGLLLLLKAPHDVVVRV